MFGGEASLELYSKAKGHGTMKHPRLSPVTQHAGVARNDDQLVVVASLPDYLYIVLFL